MNNNILKRIGEFDQLRYFSLIGIQTYVFDTGIILSDC